MEWTGARYADAPSVEVETWIQACPERVWELVSDIHLMPRLSTELHSVEWLDGAAGAGLGHRFVGRNQHADFGEWETTSTVVEFDAQCVFAWVVGDLDEPAARWRFRLEPKDDGTQLFQSAQMGPGRSGLSFAIERMPEKEQKIVYVRLKEFERNMTSTLQQIKQQLEGER